MVKGFGDPRRQTISKTSELVVHYETPHFPRQDFVFFLWGVACQPAYLLPQSNSETGRCFVSVRREIFRSGLTEHIPGRAVDARSLARMAPMSPLRTLAGIQEPVTPGQGRRLGARTGGGRRTVSTPNHLCNQPLPGRRHGKALGGGGPACPVSVPPRLRGESMGLFRVLPR